MLRKRLALLLATIILLSYIAFPNQSQANPELSVYINDELQNFTPAPFIQSGTTLVPMRAFFEALGAEVGWDNATRTATAKRGDITVALPIGSTTAYVNGEPKTLAVPAQLINGHTFIPLRFVSESLGDKVEYIPETRTIKITSSYIATKDKLRVHFIDVGQGDAILIQFPSGQNMLIDAGEDENIVASYIASQGIIRLDHVIATHPHADHIGGMAKVIKSFEIAKIYMPRTTHTTRTYENLLLAIKDKGLKITTAKAGLDIDVGDGIEAKLVAPNSDSYQNLNDYSAVLRLVYGNTSFIFTGDTESVSELEMINSGYSLKSDVLKVGHHGSSTSTTPAFLNAVSPKYAVISCGKDNSYGHPHQEVITRLNNTGVIIYRTDESGTIIAESDGSTITFDKEPSEIKEAPPGESEPLPVPIIDPIPVPITETDDDIDDSYIGNKNTKKFHLPTCSSLPAQHNRVYFKTRDEAIKAGFDPCKICRP